MRCVAHAGPGLPEAVRFVLTTDREPPHPEADGRQDLEVRSYSPSNLRLEHGTRAARKRGRVIPREAFESKFRQTL